MPVLSIDTTRCKEYNRSPYKDKIYGQKAFHQKNMFTENTNFIFHLEEQDEKLLVKPFKPWNLDESVSHATH